MEKIIIFRSKECNKSMLKEIVDTLRIKKFEVMEENMSVASSNLRKDSECIIYINELKDIEQNKKQLKLLSNCLLEMEIHPILLIDTLYERLPVEEYLFNISQVGKSFTAIIWGGPANVIQIESTNDMAKIAAMWGSPADIVQIESKENIAKSIASKIGELLEEKKIVTEKTNRGFSVFDFKDSYGHMCSIQKSSSASEPRIWLGLNKIDGFANVDNRIVNVDGRTVKVTLPESVVANARMHLNQEQVKKLLPILQKFADTGDF